MRWMAFLCFVPGAILVFIFHDMSILWFTAVVGIIGIIAVGILGHISEKNWKHLKEKEFSEINGNKRSFTR